jgi:hypothetical protein
LGHLHSHLIPFKHIEKATRIIPNPQGPLDTENSKPFDMCRELATSRDWSIPQVYTDEGYFSDTFAPKGFLPR